MLLPVLDNSLVAPERTAGHGETVGAPDRIARIGEMIRHLLHEARHVGLDDGARQRLRQVYEVSLDQIMGAVSEDLRRELSALTHRFDGTPSDGELRVAQAQLLGWLEGLAQGMHVAQMMNTQAQLEGILRKARPGDRAADGPPSGTRARHEAVGMYL